MASRKTDAAANGAHFAGKQYSQGQICRVLEEFGRGVCFHLQIFQLHGVAFSSTRVQERSASSRQARETILVIEAHGKSEAPLPLLQLADWDVRVVEAVIDRRQSMNDTLAFHIPHNLGNGILRRNRDQHVHMVKQHMPFQNFTLFVLG